jgi:hypothetical protein
VSTRSEATSLVHATYRHLDRPIRIGGLTLIHWAQLTISAIAAWALAKLLPFSATYDLSVALSITGAPAAVAIAAGTGETRPFRYLADVVRWRRHAAVYLPRRPAAPDNLIITALWD